MSASGLGQMLSEIYANEIAQGYNPFTDEWKRQVGYYGHNPVVGNETPFARIHYEPAFRFADDWWKRYRPPVIEEEELEEEPLEKILERVSYGEGGDREPREGFVDMRDPAYMSRSGYPGLKEGEWLGGSLGLSDVASMLGNMKGGAGGLLSGMFSGNLSTYGSSSGKNIIGEIADAVGVDREVALAEIGKALGYSDPATAKKDTSLLGSLFGGKPGSPNIKGMMAGELAGYPATWDNPMFDNIVNERATIAGVLNSLANPDISFGEWATDWQSPHRISDMASAFARMGTPISEMGELEKMRTSLAASMLSSMPTVDGYLKGLLDLDRDARGNLLGDIISDRPMSSWEASMLSGLGNTAAEVAEAARGKTFGELADQAKWGNMKDQSLESLVDRLERQQAYMRGETPASSGGKKESSGGSDRERGSDRDSGGRERGGYNETGERDSGGHTEKGGASEGASREGR